MVEVAAEVVVEHRGTAEVGHTSEAEEVASRRELELEPVEVEEEEVGEEEVTCTGGTGGR